MVPGIEYITGSQEQPCQSRPKTRLLPPKCNRRLKSRKRECQRPACFIITAKKETQGKSRKEGGMVDSPNAYLVVFFKADCDAESNVGQQRGPNRACSVSLFRTLSSFLLCVSLWLPMALRTSFIYLLFFFLFPHSASLERNWLPTFEKSGLQNIKPSSPFPLLNCCPKKSVPPVTSERVPEKTKEIVDYCKLTK